MIDMIIITPCSDISKAFSQFLFPGNAPTAQPGPQGLLLSAILCTRKGCGSAAFLISLWIAVKCCPLEKNHPYFHCTRKLILHNASKFPTNQSYTHYILNNGRVCCGFHDRLLYCKQYCDHQATWIPWISLLHQMPVWLSKLTSLADRRNEFTLV